MTEAAGSPRTEMERSIVQRSLEDDAFRQQLLTDPKAAVEQELGSRLPEEVRVVAVEETQDTIYLVLPSASPLGGGDELSDRELAAVAGGGWIALTGSDNTCDAYDNTCAHTCGTFC